MASKKAEARSQGRRSALRVADHCYENRRELTGLVLHQREHDQMISRISETRTILYPAQTQFGLLPSGGKS